MGHKLSRCNKCASVATVCYHIIVPCHINDLNAFIKLNPEYERFRNNCIIESRIDGQTECTKQYCNIHDEIPLGFQYKKELFNKN